MAIMNAELDNLYNEFLSKNVPNSLSMKQIEFINDLYNQFILSIDTKEKTNIFICIENILSKKINNWDNLNQDDASIIINYLQKNHINEYKKKMLRQFIIPFYSKEKIAKTINRDYDDINNITNKEYQRLTYLNPHIDFDKKIQQFSYNCKEKTVEYNPNYEIGYQESAVCKDNKLYYIRFYDYVMIDYDIQDYDKIKKRLNNFIDINPTFVFKVYKTFNGYHVFIISRLFRHSCKNTLRILKLLACDPWYIIFSHNNGFKIRLNPKISHHNALVHQYIETIGDINNIDPECIEYDNIINLKITNYKNH